MMMNPLLYVQFTSILSALLFCLFQLISVHSTSSQIIPLRQSCEEKSSKCGTNAFCYKVSLRCFCPIGYVANGDGINCDPVACSIDNQVCASKFSRFSQCDQSNGICHCSKGYEMYKLNFSSCVAQIGSNCDFDYDCGLDAQCTNHKCHCPFGYIPNGADCAFCTNNSECRRLYGDKSNCVTLCQCNENYHVDNSTKKCVPYNKFIGENCFADSACGYHATCVKHACACDLGYQPEEKTDAQNCKLKLCSANSDCTSLDSNLFCDSTGTCSCVKDYWYDHHKQICYKWYKSSIFDNIYFNIGFVLIGVILVAVGYALYRIKFKKSTN